MSLWGVGLLAPCKDKLCVSPSTLLHVRWQKMWKQSKIKLSKLDLFCEIANKIQFISIVFQNLGKWNLLVLMPTKILCMRKKHVCNLNTLTLYILMPLLLQDKMMALLYLQFSIVILQWLNMERDPVFGFPKVWHCLLLLWYLVTPVWQVWGPTAKTTQWKGYSFTACSLWVGLAFAVPLEELPSSNQHGACMSHFLAFTSIFGRKGLSLFD